MPNKIKTNLGQIIVITSILCARAMICPPENGQQQLHQVPPTEEALQVLTQQFNMGDATPAPSDAGSEDYERGFFPQSILEQEGPGQMLEKFNQIAASIRDIIGNIENGNKKDYADRCAIADGLLEALNLTNLLHCIIHSHTSIPYEVLKQEHDKLIEDLYLAILNQPSTDSAEDSTSTPTTNQEEDVGFSPTASSSSTNSPSRVTDKRSLLVNGIQLKAAQLDKLVRDELLNFVQWAINERDTSPNKYSSEEQLRYLNQLNNLLPMQHISSALNLFNYGKYVELLKIVHEIITEMGMPS